LDIFNIANVFSIV